MDVRQYIQPPTGYSKEYLIANGVVITVPVDDNGKKCHDSRVPDRIEVRPQGSRMDRVIAQTVYTDQLDFMFEGKKESLATIFTSLIFCVFSSGKSYDVSISPYSW